MASSCMRDSNRKGFTILSPASLQIKSGLRRLKMKFSDLPCFGMWEDRPQTGYEQYEVLGQLGDLFDAIYLSESESTYGCIDVREAEE